MTELPAALATKGEHFCLLKHLKMKRCEMPLWAPQS